MPEGTQGGILTEWVQVFGAAVVGAAAGVASTLLVLRAQGREARRKRRMDIRAALVKFDEVVRSLGWGAWPAGTWEAWAPERGNVLALRRRVVEELDLDRATAGKRWCRRVERCLEAGWKLVHFCSGMSVGVFKGRGAEQVVKEHGELRRQYVEAYERVQ